MGQNEFLPQIVCYQTVSMLSVLFRVKRLGYFDHTQRQLGERALYVFPAKGDATRITCEGPEGAPVLPEDPVIRKVRWIHTHYLLSTNFPTFP